MVANYMALHHMQPLDRCCFRVVSQSVWLQKGVGISGILNIRWGVRGAKPITIRDWVGPGRRAAALSLRKCSGALRGGTVPPSSSISSALYLFRLRWFCTEVVYETHPHDKA